MTPRSKTYRGRAFPYLRSTIRITTSNVVTSARLPSNVLVAERKSVFIDDQGKDALLEVWL